MDVMNAVTKVRKARTALVLDHFFFGSLALRLNVIEDKSCKTAWVDGVSFGYNPDFIDTLNLDETKGLWGHEVLHLALAHHARRGNRDSEIWNDAADYAINQILVDSGLKMPTTDGLLDDKYKGMHADKIFSELYGKRKQEQQDAADQQQKNGNDPSQQQPQPDPNSPPDPNAPPSQNGQPDPNAPQDPNAQPKKGSGSGCGEVRDYPGEDPTVGATESEMIQQEQEWQIAATQAATQAKSRGNLPGSIERLIKKLNEPKVNWREALRRFVDQVSRNDYTWRRANPRYIHTGIVLPSLYNQELPPIDLVIDTSCSVGEEELRQFASECDDILSQYPTTLRVSYADTQVRHSEEFTQENRPVTLNARGGGGTRFSPAIAAAMAQEERPVCLIYLTDMECSDFGPEPDFPVLWVQTFGDRAEEPPFGELIVAQFD